MLLTAGSFLRFLGGAGIRANGWACGACLAGTEWCWLGLWARFRLWLLVAVGLGLLERWLGWVPLGPVGRSASGRLVWPLVVVGPCLGSHGVAAVSQVAWYGRWWCGPSGLGLVWLSACSK